MSDPLFELDTFYGEGDRDLESVRSVLLSADPHGVRFATVFRRTIDMLLDGQNTGRFRWEQLHKTEKTHAGTLVEINFQREFSFADGDKMDYKIADVDVDCKFSQDFGKWMIPPEAIGHLCLLTWCNDNLGEWSAGLLRISESELSIGKNRDGKRYLNKSGRAAVSWLFRGEKLPENALLRMSPDDIRAIFAPKSGQSRINELFRRAQGRIVSRAVVATVGQQDDYMKRVRFNGGARSKLRPEGIVILGQFGNHVDVASRLNLPLPKGGESISVRLAKWVPEDGEVPRARIGGEVWRIASSDDPPCLAPILPER
ncbi:NaeI family type II restriction endonuclease [Catenuloplanes sp. NPDC051500]|uniref:NaeI family type II restriction endonuclease n=1 Tax=Catenuloplanes sp. NPDC051500 TaxID=3363959 RepID=UPI0037902D6A